MKKKALPQGYMPSVKDAEWFINTWREVGKFSAPVDAMFKICQQYPNNNNLEEVLIKCAVIDNYSSTNVFDLYKMADHIVGMHIDERLESGHYSLVDEIAKVEMGGKKRYFYSFASKYCHYHKPDRFAIYDSYVGDPNWDYDSQSFEEWLEYIISTYGPIKEFPIEEIMSNDEIWPKVDVVYHDSFKGIFELQ